MPITRPPTPEEAAWYKSQGIDPSTVQLTVDDSGQQQQNSGDLGIARSALAPLIARAGGIVGTGLGGLVTGALAGTEFGPPGMIVGGLIGAGLGGLGGQKAQQAIVPTATQQALEQEAQEAYQQHPLVAGASELGATALAGGGRFSLSPIRAALSGSRSALRNLAIANAINVGGGLGMNAATQLYNTGQLNPRELGVGALENLAAGSFFANPSRWGKIATRGQWRDIDTAAEDVQSQQEEPDENAGPLSPIGEQALALSKQSTDEAVQVRNNAAFLQNNDSAINEALRIQRAKNNADIVLDNTAFPDSLLNKNFKKLYKPVTGDMTDQANAMAYNNGLKSMNNAQRRQFMYQKMLENISPDVANAHKDYQQYWTDVTKRQDQEWVNAQNSRIMQAQIAQEREAQATQERTQAAEQYAKEQKAVKAQQEAEAWRQQNLFNAEQNRQQNITCQALAGGPASQERVEKTNLPENAAQGALSEVGRPEQVATGEGRELPQVTPEENQQALEHEAIQQQLEDKNASVEGANELRTPTNVRNLIASQSSNVKDILTQFSKENHLFSPLAKVYLENSDLKGLSVPITWDMGAKRSWYRGTADRGAGRIFMSKTGIYSAVSVMHEITHGLVGNKIPPEFLNPSYGASYGKEYYNNLVKYLANPKGNKAIQGLVGSYLETAHKLGHAKALFEGGMVEQPWRMPTRPYNGGRVVSLRDPDVAQRSFDALRAQYPETQDGLSIEGNVLRFTPELANKLLTSGKMTPEGHIVYKAALEQKRATAGNQDLTVKRGIPYGLGNLDEFLAEAFSNPKFQKQLASIKSEHDQSTIWQHVVDAIKHLLGMNDIQGTMLERVLSQGAELMHQERPEGVKGLDINKTQTGGVKQEPIEDSSRAQELENQTRTLQPGSPEHTQAMVELSQLHDKLGDKFEPPVETQPVQLNTDEGNKTKADIITRTVGRVTRAGIDAVKAIGVTGKKVAPMLQGTFDDYHPIFGKHWTPEHMTTRKLTDVQLKHVDQILQLENLRKADHSFMLRSDVEKRAYRVIRDHLDEQGDERIALKAPIWENGVPREFIKDPWYYPNTQNRRMYDGLRQGDEKIIAEAKAAFIPHQQQYNPKGKYYGFSKVWSDHLASNPQDIVNKELQAQMKEQYASTGKGYETLWNDHLNSVQGSGKYMNNPSLAIYAAVRRPERIPLPDIMRNTNVRENLFSYNRRYAMDSSFYKNIENNPEVSPHLGFTTDGWGKPINTEGKNNIAGNSTVRTILEMIHGEVEPLLQRNESAVENVANAFILGPLTEIHKMISPIGQSFTFAHNPVEAAKSFVYAISHLGEGWSHALENGIVIHKPNDILDFTKANLTFAEKVNAFANAFRKIYTLNGLTERFSVGYAQAASEYLVRSKLVGARYGSETDINLLKRLDPQWTKDTQYTDPKVDELASRLAGYLIGTKDPRTLPAWLLHDNEISAFFKLLNWNVAQTNNFFNNAWAPAMKGDILPLIMTTFGASLGGYVIRELRTKLSGRPMQIPSLSDIANADHLNKTALFYNWISAASYGGLGGIVSLAARYPLDIHFRNNLQGAIFPLDEIVSSYSTVAANVADALANDPTADPVKIISRAFTDIITKNTQIGRTIFNQAVNAGVLTERSSNPEIAESVFEKQQADKLNQLKHFKQVNELPLNPASDFAGNPYLNMEQKTFKHQTDVGKAVATLPEIIQHYIQYYGAKSPDILMNKLEGLKANPYDVFPSIETEPLVFARYLGFLQKKFGQQEANSLLADYMKRRTINEAKASVVP